VSTARQAAIAKVGKAIHRAHQNETAAHAMIEAIAAMIDFAITKPTKVVKVPVAPLPFGPQAIFDRFEAEFPPELVQLRPYDKSSFGQLGKALQRMSKLELGDLDLVIAWIHSGGLNSWPTHVTWKHVCRHFTSWVNYARGWDEKVRNGSCQTASGSDAWR
jgi:hypothetical protein